MDAVDGLLITQVVTKLRILDIDDPKIVQKLTFLGY